VPAADQPNEQFLAAFMDDYFAECDEHLATVRRRLLRAEAGEPLSSQSVEELFRAMHSIKGLSGMVELHDAEVVAHHMESYLRVLRGHTAIFDDEGLGALIEGTHTLEQVIAARRDGGPAPPIDVTLARLSHLVARSEHVDRDRPMDAVAANRDVVAATDRWRAIFRPSAQLAAHGITVDHARQLLRATGEIVEATPQVGSDGSVLFEFSMRGGFDQIDADAFRAAALSVERIESAPVSGAPASEERPGGPAAGGLSPSHYVRVDLGRLDDLMRMIGDLVIGRARLAESLSKVEAQVAPAHWRAIQENNLTIERQLRDLREGVMRVRLVPIGEIFRRMPFVVRDLAKDANKQVELELRGEDTEIDKFLVERLLDPLVHLVRNAISHGIESPEERRRIGKPDVGRIALSAASVGDRVIIEVSDDGRGVDVAKVVTRAEALGLPVPKDTENLDGILSLLCSPGFSTRDAADRASGRGVGMSVVQTSISELGGHLTLDSAPGQGTRFILELPVTLAITDAIIARVGGQLFAIPQGSVREIVQFDTASVRAVENNELAPYRASVLPLVRLSSLFGLEAAPRPRLNTFVIGQGTAAYGLVVDAIVGQREIVVRPLVDALVKVDGVVGATDLGDGRVVLILDPTRVTGRHMTGNRT
jgi:two-component system chemotaxis sensor kinase CheA